jgi:hypothetical protein
MHMGPVETIEGDKRANITATAIPAQGGTLIGIYVSSTSSGTFVVSDAKGAITGTVTPAAGTFHRIPCKFYGGLTVTIANTLNCTVFWK